MNHNIVKFQAPSTKYQAPNPKLIIKYHKKCYFLEFACPPVLMTMAGGGFLYYWDLSFFTSAASSSIFFSSDLFSSINSCTALTVTIWAL